jgi:GPH family glycoside/pentoside/hexuronide:cation symporter
MNDPDYFIEEGAWKIASTAKMMSYSFGFVLSLYLLLAYQTFIFYFYEVEIGLRANYVSLAIILYSVYVIISSPILGYLTDRSFRWSKKLGFRAPWVILSAIPALIFYFLLFLPPELNAEANPWLFFWYLLIISCIFSTFLTIFREHFEGSFANQFREDFERRRASAFAFIFPGTILFFMSAFPLFIIKYGEKSTFVLTALISVIIMAICVICLIPGIHESSEMKMRALQGYEKDKKQIPFIKMMKISFKQKNFKITLLAFTLTSTATSLDYASGIYFFKDVLRLPIYLSVYGTIVYFVFVMVAVPFWVSFARKHGNAKTMILSLFLVGLSYLPYLWITTLLETIIYAVFRGIASAGFMVMSLPIVADCYDEVTLACERHQEATLLGIRIIFLRSSVIFQALIIGAIHIFTAYNNDPNAVQTDLAVWGVRVHRALIPMLLFFFAFLIMALTYDLKGENVQLLKQQLRLKGL